MSVHDGRKNNGNGIAGRKPLGMFLRSEAAALIGRSTDTLKRWEAEGVYVPSDSMQMGKLTVRLYSAADIEAMKALVEGHAA